MEKTIENAPKGGIEIRVGQSVQNQFNNSYYNCYIYRALEGSKEVFRVAIGREGTECPPMKNRIEDYKTSDFIPGPEMQTWVQTEVDELLLHGHEIRFDSENSSFLLDARLAGVGPKYKEQIKLID